MKLLETFIPESLVEALGWTLLHSLWQGLLLGAILLVIFRLNRDISPRIKYGISLVSLFALPLTAVITFSMLYHTGETSTNVMGRLLQDTVFVAEPASVSMSGAGMEIPITEILAGAFDWLIPVWLLGVFLLSARLTGGLFLTARMRREGITIPDIEWLARFKSLQSRTGIKMSIRYLQSIKIQVPSVSGIFKPVILLPASMLSGLPADQIESVIVHELAHIKRFDFLVNILQTLVEAIFFYHPVVWLISQQVRREREKCCDDFAVAVCGKISIYARALAGMSEMRTASPVPAVALSGNKNQIINRVERLLKSKKMKNNANERWVAGLIIMASALLITVSTGAALIKVYTPSLTGPVTEIQVPSEPATEIQVPSEPAPVIDITTLLQTEHAVEIQEPDTHVEPIVQPEILAALESPLPAETPPIPTPLPDSSMQYEVMDNMVSNNFRDKDGNKKNMRFHIKNGEVKELYVDGERVPEDKMSNYDKEIKKVLADLSDMERELIDARTELEELDPDKLKEELHREMLHLREFELQELHENLARIHEDIHMDINMDSLRAELKEAMEVMKEKMNDEEWQFKMQQMEKEMQTAMQEAHKRMEEIHWDEEKMQMTIEESMLRIQDIDYEAIERSVQEAMAKMQDIDFTKMEENIRKSLENLEKENFHMQNRMKTLDEMIIELEKLELEEK